MSEACRRCVSVAAQTVSSTTRETGFLARRRVVSPRIIRLCRRALAESICPARSAGYSITPDHARPRDPRHLIQSVSMWTCPTPLKGALGRAGLLSRSSTSKSSSCASCASASQNWRAFAESSGVSRHRPAGGSLEIGGTAELVPAVGYGARATARPRESGCEWGCETGW